MINKITLLLIISILFSCQNQNNLYKEYIQQYKESSQIIENQNLHYINRFKKYDYNHAKKQHAPNFELRQKTENTSKLIDSIINTISNIEASKKYKPNRLLIQNLESQISDIKKLCTASIRDKEMNAMFIKSIDNNLDTKRPINLDSIISKSTNKEEPIALLQKTKNDLLLVENALIFHIMSYGYEEEFFFSNTHAIAIQNTTHLSNGGTFSSEIYLGSYNKDYPLDYIIDGKKYSGINGNIFYKHKVVAKPGLVEKNGRFLINQPKTGKTLKFPFTLKYEVIE